MHGAIVCAASAAARANKFFRVMNSDADQCDQSVFD